MRREYSFMVEPRIIGYLGASADDPLSITYPDDDRRYQVRWFDPKAKEWRILYPLANGCPMIHNARAGMGYDRNGNLIIVSIE